MGEQEKLKLESILTPEERGRKIEQRTNEILNDLLRSVLKERGEEQFWGEKLPLISAMLASVEHYQGKKIDSTSLNQLVKAKPFQKMKILEFGFGPPNDSHLLLLTQFGAEMYGVESNAESAKHMREGWVIQSDHLDYNGMLLFSQENIKTGDAKDVATLFPGINFDMLISSRVIEEYPMSGAYDFQVGVTRAEDILKRTKQALPDGGLSVHTTTQRFIIDDEESIKRMGYEVPVLNKNFGNNGGSVSYFTILRKKY